MARREIVEQIIQTFKELGGNLSDVLGTRTNISFLGKGDNIEPFLDKNLNTEALGVLSQSKAIDEAKNAVGFAVSNKLNDIQATNLLTNLNKMKEFYMPPDAPANIIDLGTRTRNLDAEGLMALRDDIDLPEGVAAEETILPSRTVFGLKDYDTSGMSDTKKRIIQLEEKLGSLNADSPTFKKRADEIIDELARLKGDDIDLPPPGSRGGPDDISAPFQDAETTIANLEKQDPELAAQFKAMMMGGSNQGGNPAKRATAREFLVEALKKENPNQTGFADIVSAEDVKFITEGGGGIGGDPIVLVNKYFGPRIADLIPEGASSEELVIFTNRVLNNVVDANGLRPTDANFDRFTAQFIEEMADGGRAGYFKGKLVGKALGLSKRIANINKSVDEGTEMGYQALRKYGLEAEDITRLFKEIAMDRTLVGKEKTEYFKMLNQVLKNPDDFPDGIIEIKKRLGMDFARGGLAKILEV